ncbi:MAG: 5-(carboxyamino)imidazole ribonucleotide mutase [Clostridia bacterium]|nr:5-(carboxyamino)imidazole ribonucleotide mutase [Clostridia bacterium]
MKKVAVLMGSDSDFEKVKPAFKVFDDFGIEFETHVMSAHRTPEKVTQFAQNAISNDFGVIIAAAGMAAHLAGFIAANTVLPVIGIPIKSSFEGLDSLLATVQMPSGIPVATVALNGSKNAAILATEILSLSDEQLQKKLIDMRADMKKEIEKKDNKIQDLI